MNGKAASLEDLLRGVPKGAFWMTGERWSQLLTALIADRARLFGSSGSVIPTSKGRFFDIDAGTGGGGGSAAHPFRIVLTQPDPVPEPPEPNWVKVTLYSHLLASLLPTDLVEITGLDVPFQMEVDQYIWLAVDLTPTYDSTPGPPTASIEHGDDWNDGNDIFPDPILWDTDDGTPTGSDPAELPPTRRQTHLYVPLGRTIVSDPDDPAELPGILLGEDLKLIQMWRDHMLLARTCYRGSDVAYVIPFGAGMPEPA